MLVIQTKEIVNNNKKIQGVAIKKKYMRNKYRPSQ